MEAYKVKKPKKHYHIILNGECVGDSWAVSPVKAINNYWWKSIKNENQMSPRYCDPADFDAVEA